MGRLFSVVILIGLLCFTGIVFGADQSSHPEQTATPVMTVSKIDTGDTAWILISTALVMLMTPGLALFYGGMVRGKNVLGTIMQSFIAIAVISVQWILIGYSLSFGPDVNGIIGNLSWIGLSGVGIEPNPDYAPTIPHMAFMMYQAMFAVITPALITGAFAERMKFSAYLLFILLWSTIVYDPVAHWVWGAGGWLEENGHSGFCRRYRCTSHIRNLSSCSSNNHRQEERVYAGGDVPPQPPDDRPWNRTPVVRLVWFQCWKRPFSRALKCHGFCCNPYLCCGCNINMGDHRMAAQGKANNVWCCYRFHCRSCNNNPGIRFRKPDVLH